MVSVRAFLPPLFGITLAAAAMAVTGLASPLDAQPRADCHRPVTALVLSGGGATGLAHIGVLRAIDEAGIQIDRIVASSMGAVVGGMYASGYTAVQLDSIVRATPLHELFGAGTPVPMPLGEWPRLVVLRRGPRGLGPQMPFVDERRLNLVLSELLLRGNVAAGGDFDAMPIPFRAVATDLESREAVALGAGDLALAVRASLAIPIIFPPVRIDSRWTGDGGLTANIPVNFARELGAERVIVSDATDHARTLDPYGVSDMAKLMLSLVMTQKPDSLGPVDVLVRTDVDGFGKLDFSPAVKAKLIERGYRAGVEVLHGDACPARAGAESAAGGRVEGVGGDDDTRRALRGGAATVDVQVIAAGLRNVALRNPLYDAIWLHPLTAAGGASFEPDSVRASRVLAAGGAVWDHELGIHAWFGMLDRGLLDWRLALTARAAAGRLRQELDMTARAPGRGMTFAVLSGSIANEKVRRFTARGAALEAVESRQANVTLGPERDLGDGWIVGTGALYVAWHDTAATRSAVGLGAYVSRTSRFRAITGRADVEWATSHARVSLALATPFDVRGFRLVPRVRYGWGRSLPLPSEFALGGSEGFPGLHLGERRGDHEALAGFDLRHALLGPLLLCVDVDAGLAGPDGGVLPRGDWLLGARAGVAFDTPGGLIRVEYGAASGGRSAFFARVGTWF